MTSKRTHNQQSGARGRRAVLRGGAAIGSTLAFGGIWISGLASGQSDTIPTDQTTYQVRIAGQTSHEEFDREGAFFVSPPVGPADTHPRDIALTSGNPQGAPEGGAIEFVTNTALRTVLNLGGNPALNDSAIQVGSVQIDEASGRLQAQPIDDQGIDLGPGVRAGLQVNVFTPQSGAVAPLYELADGILDVQFQGNQVSGTVDFTGISLGGAQDQAQVQAQFAGSA